MYTSVDPCIPCTIVGLIRSLVKAEPWSYQQHPYHPPNLTRPPPTEQLEQQLDQQQLEQFKKLQQLELQTAAAQTNSFSSSLEQQVQHLNGMSYQMQRVSAAACMSKSEESIWV